MNNITISIGITIYNTKISDFNKCINSLKKQTYKNFNIILVDNGSDTKNSICYESIVKKSNLNYYYYKYKKNIGISQGINCIYDIFKNKLNYQALLFLDSDDWLELNALYLLNKYKKNNDIVMFGINYDSNKSSLQETCFSFDKKIKHNFSKFNDFYKIHHLLTMRYLKIFSREYILKHYDNILWDYKNEKDREETFFHLYNLATSDKILFIKNNLYHFRINDTGISSKWRSDKEFYMHLIIQVRDSLKLLLENKTLSMNKLCSLFNSNMNAALFYENKCNRVFRKKYRYERKKIFNLIKNNISFKEKMFYKKIIFLYLIKRVFSYLYLTVLVKKIKMIFKIIKRIINI